MGVITPIFLKGFVSWTNIFLWKRFHDFKIDKRQKIRYNISRIRNKGVF